MTDSPVQAETGPLLEVRDLTVSYRRRGKPLLAVDRVSLQLQAGEILALAGESGSGKSSLARTLVGLQRPASGQVLLRGENLLEARGGWLREARRRVQIVFQDPSTALSPRRTVAQALSEPLRHFRIGERAGERGRISAALGAVGLETTLATRYPHQLSSGQRQRVALARALIVEPELLVADEPVSALDVSVQAQVLELLRRARAETGVAILLISHDLAVIRQLADRLAMMYRGRLVELGSAGRVLGDPLHPYSRQLLEAAPSLRLQMRAPALPAGALLAPAGDVSGCSFRQRCPRRMDRCAYQAPRLVSVSEPPGHRVECHLYDPPDA